MPSLSDYLDKETVPEQDHDDQGGDPAPMPELAPMTITGLQRVRAEYKRLMAEERRLRAEKAVLYLNHLMDAKGRLGFLSSAAGMLARTTWHRQRGCGGSIGPAQTRDLTDRTYVQGVARFIRSHCISLCGSTASRRCHSK